jgi:hypothetical protein
MAAFTTVAAGVGLATTAATTGMSFAQARKQRKIQQQAEDEASKMMAEARKKLEVNYYDQLAIQKEPYELEREAIIAAGAQAIEAGKESERGAAAVAGRVQMAQQQGQREIATAMGQEMMGLEKLSAQEDARLRDVGIQLDLSEVEGAQLAAAQAAEAKGLATQQGIQGVTSLVTQGLSLYPLYARKKGIDPLTGLPIVPTTTSATNTPATNTPLSTNQVGQMTPQDMSKLFPNLTTEQKMQLFNDPKFMAQFQGMSKMPQGNLSQIGSDYLNYGGIDNSKSYINPYNLSADQRAKLLGIPNIDAQFMNPFYIPNR